MRKIFGILFAFAMILSVALISDAVSEHNPFAAQAQTRQGRVTVKKKKRGVASQTYRGSKYIYRKARNGTVYIYRKTAKGVVYVGKKTYKGSKYIGKKTYKGTKYVGKKTVKGTRATVSRTKKIFN
ncbi:MAG: hypothetical protein R2747_17355 [Pyrinomonadaceae bacterium]